MQNSAKKGMIKSDNPDLLVNIFTKERERIGVTMLVGVMDGVRMEPLLMGGRSYVSSTEGTLY
jgi:hypothetical protein